MAIAESYRKQAALLIRTVPFVASEKEFALKGGTAINLFVRDMPRLSVDIDLAPQRLDISAEYKRGFEGMVEQAVSLDDLLKAREDLISEIVGKMPEQHKKFLVSVKKGEPDWSLFDLPSAKDLPAVRWKLENLAKLPGSKRAQLLSGLSEALRIMA